MTRTSTFDALIVDDNYNEFTAKVTVERTLTEVMDYDYTVAGKPECSEQVVRDQVKDAIWDRFHSNVDYIRKSA